MWIPSGCGTSILSIYNTHKTCQNPECNFKEQPNTIIVTGTHKNLTLKTCLFLNVIPKTQIRTGMCKKLF